MENEYFPVLREMEQKLMDGFIRLFYAESKNRRNMQASLQLSAQILFY